MEAKSVGILGSGAWGTGMAQALARGGHLVEIWALEQDVSDSINLKSENSRFLPGYPLSKNIFASCNLEKVANEKDYLIFASPSLYICQIAKKVAQTKTIAQGKTCIGVLTKGFVPSNEGPSLILEELEKVLPSFYKNSLVYIAGPSHAEEVVAGKLTGLIAASENALNSIKFRELLRVPGLMVYSSLDVVGVQICAASKNVIAIIFGMLDAISENSNIFGDNTESFLLAAGLNEIQTLGFAMGATHAETFTSIAGVGDLDVTCRSKYGRNRRFGQDIIKKNILSGFKNLDDLILRINEIGYLPEGVVACKYIHEIAQKKSIKLQICEGLYRILNKEITPEGYMNELSVFPND